MTLLWLATMSILDAKGETSKEKFHLDSPDLDAIADAGDDPVEFIQEMARFQDAVITGQITRLMLTIEVELPSGIKTAPLALSDVQEGVLYLLRTANNSAVRLRIPTFDESLILVDGTVDSSEAAVIDLDELLTIPEELPADWGIGVTDNRGDAVKQIEYASEKFYGKAGSDG